MTTEKTMTNREFLEAIVAMRATIGDELADYAEAGIAKLDGVNEKRREATAKKAAEKEADRAPIREAILACITTEAKTATMLIAEAGVDKKPQAIPSLLKPLIEAGKVDKVEVKIAGKGKQVGYVLGIGAEVAE